MRSTIVERKLGVGRMHSWWQTAEGFCPLPPPQDMQIGLCVCLCGWMANLSRRGGSPRSLDIWGRVRIKYMLGGTGWGVKIVR